MKPTLDFNFPHFIFSLNNYLDFILLFVVFLWAFEHDKALFVFLTIEQIIYRNFKCFFCFAIVKKFNHCVSFHVPIVLYSFGNLSIDKYAKLIQIMEVNAPVRAIIKSSNQKGRNSVKAIWNKYRMIEYRSSTLLLLELWFVVVAKNVNKLYFCFVAGCTFLWSFSSLLIEEIGRLSS